MPLIGAPQGQHNWWTKGLGGSRRTLRNWTAGQTTAKSVAQEGRKVKPIPPPTDSHFTVRKTSRTNLTSLKPAKDFFSLSLKITSSFLFFFLFLFLLPAIFYSFFKKFFIVIQLQLCAFSPHPSTSPQTNPPPSPTSTLPLDFVHVSFIVVPVIPSPHCPLPTPP